MPWQSGRLRRRSIFFDGWEQMWNAFAIAVWTLVERLCDVEIVHAGAHALARAAERIGAPLA